MKNTKNKINKKNELLFLHQKKIIKMYKSGYNLGEICRKFCLDLTTILFIIRKKRFKKKRSILYLKNN